MNKQALLGIASILENLDRNKFDMTVWIDNSSSYEDEISCKTRACIAGHTVIQFGTDLQKEEFLDSTGAADRIATNILGLDRPTANKLFLPGFPSMSADNKIAAQVIRNLVETGEVHWPEESHVTRRR